MPIYLDTSLLVAALCSETKADAAYRWIDEQAVGSLAISMWSRTEFSSALAIKLRTGQIGPQMIVAIQPVWEEMQHDMLMMVAVESSDFARAATMIERSSIPLRSGDALHLAIAERNAMELASFDSRMVAAAQAFGMVAITP